MGVLALVFLCLRGPTCRPLSKEAVPNSAAPRARRADRPAWPSWWGLSWVSADTAPACVDPWGSLGHLELPSPQRWPHQASRFASLLPRLWCRTKNGSNTDLCCRKPASSAGSTITCRVAVEGSAPGRRMSRLQYNHIEHLDNFAGGKAPRIK